MNWIFEKAPLCSMAFMAGGQAPAETNTPYNVLLIMVDDLNDWAGFIGGHPQAITLNMDKLASMGMVFERAYCAAPVCNPSRAAMMTGLRPSTTGVYGNTQNFRNTREGRTVKTMPEYFKEHGYHTVSRGKIYHRPDGAMAFPETWNEWLPYEGSRMGFSLANIDRQNKIAASGMPYSDNSQLSFDWGPVQIDSDKTSDYLAAQWAGDELRKEHDKPFFMAVGIFRPHLPFYVPQKYFDMYPDAQELWIPEIDPSDLDDLPEEGLSMTGRDNPESDYNRLARYGKLHEIVKGYLAAMSYADDCVGEILKGLKDGPNLDNTIVILSGDHGWHFGEKLHYRKGTMWERSARTTFTMRVPGMTESGNRTKEIISLLDIYPTLTDLCGLPPYERNEGTSFRAVLENPQQSHKRTAVTTKDYNAHSVRTDQWRLIKYEAGGLELYDHSKDPDEKVNLAGDETYQSLIAELSALLPETSCPPAPDGEELIEFEPFLWMGSDQGEWNIPANWTGGEIPSGKDSVVINSRKKQVNIENIIAQAGTVDLRDGTIYIYQSSDSRLRVAGDFKQSGGLLHFRTAGTAEIGGNYLAAGGAVRLLQGSTPALTVNGNFTVQDFTVEFIWNNSQPRSIQIAGAISLNNATLTMSKYDSTDLSGAVLLIHNTSPSAVSGSFANVPWGTVYKIAGANYKLELSDWDQSGIKNDICLVPAP